MKATWDSGINLRIFVYLLSEFILFRRIATVSGQLIVYLFEVGVKQAQPIALPVSESRAITQQCSPSS